jgi:thiamine-monophosphate kinase
MRKLTPPTTLKGQGELALIDRIRRRAAKSSGTRLSLGIGDDCALLRLKASEEIAVTTDLSIEGRHFRLDLHPPEAIGHRALARGLSDIAAMGARPIAAFLSLGAPPELILASRPKAPAWIDRFLDGFLCLADKHKTPLAGGDLAQSPIAVADVVLIGSVPRGKALLRSGSKPGDLLYVTGSLGGSSLGLRQLGSTGAGDLQPHLYPQPRIAQGLWLQQRTAVSAAIDISDGISTDLHHLCEESGVSAEIQTSCLPIFPGASLEDALNGGEDYELLFTAHANTRIPRSIGGVPLTRIGVITKFRPATPRVLLVDALRRGRPLEPRGWEHFRTGTPE